MRSGYETHGPARKTVRSRSDAIHSDCHTGSGCLDLAIVGHPGPAASTRDARPSTLSAMMVGLMPAVLAMSLPLGLLFACTGVAWQWADEAN